MCFYINKYAEDNTNSITHKIVHPILSGAESLFFLIAIIKQATAKQNITIEIIVLVVILKSLIKVFNIQFHTASIIHLFCKIIIYKI